MHGRGGRLTTPDDDIYLGNNGTATRFLTSVVSLCQGECIIDGDSRMRQRPIGPLVEALRGWGVISNPSTAMAARRFPLSRTESRR